MKNGKRAYLRSFCLSAVVIFCALALFFGAVAVYRAVNLTLNAGYEDPVSVTEKGIRFLDFFFSF